MHTLGQAPARGDNFLHSDTAEVGCIYVAELPNGDRYFGYRSVVETETGEMRSFDAPLTGPMSRAEARHRFAAAIYAAEAEGKSERVLDVLQSAVRRVMEVRRG